jgi:putative heme-binding domain-containing protein
MRTLSLFLLRAALLIAAGKGTAAVTPPEQISVPAGFKVELLREAGPREGSWICMAQDEQGRLYISPQNAIPESGFSKDSKWGGIWRVTLGTDGTDEPKGAQPGEIRNPQSAIRNFEKVPVPVGDAMGMLWAFDSLYVSGMGPQGRGIYRCKDTDGDGNLDTATLFKAIPGGAGEHGAHAIVLGPDKKLYIVNGNSTGILDGLAPDSPYRNWGEDDLLPRLKDPVATFFDKIKAPYGCVYRTDADGTKWELFAGGFRNPYDIAFNADGELFTYDSDMEWDRGLPWYRPTRILHVVPGGEYGFREGSAKWPAYFPDSLPAVADIGVGCPTGMKFGTEAKGWPEKYRRALFLHDWTYGRILAVTLREKGASYTARNDLASYTYPRDAEANGDVEVFLSGKAMPVTDLEFLRDGSMVFTVGGRGTAAALYRVSYEGKMGAEIDATDGASEPVAKLAHLNEAMEKLMHPPRKNEAAPLSLTPAELAAQIEHNKARNRELLAKLDEAERAIEELGRTAAHNAPEAQRKLAGGAASEASATTGSPSAKASAPAGAQEEQSQKLGAFYRAMVFRRPDLLSALEHAAERMEVDRTLLADDLVYSRDRFQIASWIDNCGSYIAPKEFPKALQEAVAAGAAFTKHDALNAPFHLTTILGIVKNGAPALQAASLQALTKFPLKAEWMDDDLKLFKLRVLELSFARQGRPAEERVKALMEELLAHYPAAGVAKGAAASGALPQGALASSPATTPIGAAALPNGARKTDARESGAARAGDVAGGTPALPGAPVDAPAWRLNRELCALLTWLSNPELGALNADLTAKPGEPAKGKTGADGAKKPKGGQNRQKGHLGWQNAIFALGGDSPSAGDVPLSRANVTLSGANVTLSGASVTLSGASVTLSGASVTLSDASVPLIEPNAPLSPPNVAQNSDKPTTRPAAAPAPADPLPSEAPPVPPGSRPAVLNSAPNAGLGPVPNPGTDIFPGRQPWAFQTELGRQVIEKTLALMDAAPSQEEQVWYALCLRWAHGWTPAQRVRYFRWFHEKAARYTGGNSFAKFVEAIRADAASRVPWPEQAAISQWLRPVASPVPAAALKPRAFVKAWTLPELEAALDKLKDRKPDLARGKDLYTQAQCAQCHLFRDAGGNVGPDLTAVAQRFGRHDILESITDPSKVVSEQYAMVTLTILDGKGGTAEVSGLVKDESSATITILTDPLAGKTSNLYKNVIVKREKAAVSIMPPGLLYTLTAEEVADLLALFGAK